MLIHTMQLKQLQIFTNTYEEPASLPTRDAHSLHTRLCREEDWDTFQLNAVYPVDMYPSEMMYVQRSAL